MSELLEIPARYHDVKILTINECGRSFIRQNLEIAGGEISDLFELLKVPEEDNHTGVLLRVLRGRFAMLTGEPLQPDFAITECNRATQPLGGV